MKNKAFLIYFLTFLLYCSGQVLSGQVKKQMTSKRFALVVGSNNGGPDRVKLQYAVSDAENLINVLKDMGGIMTGDSVLLKEPDRDTFFTQLKKMQSRVAQAKNKFRRVEAVFYYSGHSDENHILLGQDKVSYQELKDAVSSMQADVRIAILDSCASGAFTRLKGGKKKSPFLLDTAYDMQGYAFLTSSSADESSQESDRIKASFFTHNLVTGLRGAADMTHDGRITLQEVYQYAYSGTLTQTEKTINGPQHPNVDVQMTGTGDVVLTEISNSSTVLVLTEDISGRIFIHDDKNMLVVEMTKAAGRAIELGLEARKYRITIVHDGNILETQVSMQKGKSFELSLAHFKIIAKESAVSRGRISEGVPLKKKRKKFQFELYGGLSSLDPADLNLRAEAESIITKFFRQEKYSWWQANGYVNNFYSDMSGDFEEISHGFPFGFRLKYYISKYFALSLGLKYISKTQTSKVINHYTIEEISGYTYVRKHEKFPYILQARGLTPLLGLHYEREISRRLGLEAFVAMGPLFAECLYSFDSYIEMPYEEAGISDTSGFIVLNMYRRFLEEKGRGTGFSSELCARLNIDIGKKFGLFLETGYAFQIVQDPEGPGREIINGESMSWKGEWGVKEIHEPYYWGDVYYQYPSNYWKDDHVKYRLRDFDLKLSGFQLRIGISRRF